MKLLTISITAAALLVAGGTASAQSASDVGCILVSNVFAKSSKEAEAKRLAEASLYFYMGRIGENATAAQLKPLLQQQAKVLDEKSAPGKMNACVAGFQAKMNLMQSLSTQPAAAVQKQPQGR